MPEYFSGYKTEDDWDRFVESNLPYCESPDRQRFATKQFVQTVVESGEDFGPYIVGVEITRDEEGNIKNRRGVFIESKNGKVLWFRSSNLL